VTGELMPARPPKHALAAIRILSIVEALAALNP
jgi:hypothetical protein